MLLEVEVVKCDQVLQLGLSSTARLMRFSWLPMREDHSGSHALRLPFLRLAISGNYRRHECVHGLVACLDVLDVAAPSKDFLPLS